ncbi:Inhibitor of growth protein 5 [Borealophlyctis nickersoniae]|nr:Inhibitor of growth protein 5 [Borealophlyctis nickersoniae]
MALVYLEDYLDTIEALPAELSRNFTLMRELDARAQDAVKKVEADTAQFMEQLSNLDQASRIAALQSIAAAFRETLRHGEDKVALAVQTYEMVDKHIRRLDDDLGKFEDEQMTGPKFIGTSNTAGREEASSRGSSSKIKESHKAEKRSAPPTNETPPKKRKTKHIDEKGKDLGREGTPKKVQNGKGVSTSHKAGKTGIKKGEAKLSKDKAIVLDLPIDPNEPTYCICHQVSYGEMIAVSAVF